MQTQELATILKDRCLTAAKGEQVLSLNLVGIECAEALEGQSLQELCEIAGLPRSYGTELSKARRLAPYVQLKT